MDSPHLSLLVVTEHRKLQQRNAQKDDAQKDGIHPLADPLTDEPISPSIMAGGYFNDINTRLGSFRLKRGESALFMLKHRALRRVVSLKQLVITPNMQWSTLKRTSNGAAKVYSQLFCGSRNTAMGTSRISSLPKTWQTLSVSLRTISFLFFAPEPSGRKKSGKTSSLVVVDVDAKPSSSQGMEGVLASSLDFDMGPSSPILPSCTQNLIAIKDEGLAARLEIPL